MATQRKHRGRVEEGKKNLEIEFRGYQHFKKSCFYCGKTDTTQNIPF